ncbi:TonB family C-terminal domain-containing protein [Reichenbachiella agariperforans]|uniref:TonB family C-terminal domain-containing protein n=1 Tax=Reichenbachiella agariperforans TaxID=156994 RepID=A0A1M6TE40_REIAG|nr:TonB family protein [Reichenbachiella agariperforans]SHK55233.1 TonB family C-terminal domain-containing protein [Reichenbachiella agariperforans]
MNKDRPHIEPLSELTPALMQQYLRDELSPEMRHAVERYLLDHPFEAEAMRGYESVSVEMEKDVATLVERLAMAKSDAKVVPIWKNPMRIAAAVALLLMGSFSIWMVMDTLSEEDTIVMKEDTPVKPEKEQAQPPLSKPVTEEIEAVEPSKKIVAPTPKHKVSPPKETPKQDMLEIAVETEGQPMPEQEESPSLADEELAETVYSVEEDVVPINQAAEESMAMSSQPALAARMKKRQSVATSDGSYSSKTVYGKVVGSDGEDIPGATVWIKETGEGTVTDIEGRFEVSNAHEGETLEVNFIGYSSEQIRIGANDTILAVMEIDMASLDEVVVIGYGESRPKPDAGATPVDGFLKYKRYIKENLRYPVAAKELQIEGKVTVRFTVDSYGNVSDIVIKKGLGYGCDEEAIRLITEGPSWKPSIRDNQSVEDVITLRIKFSLE